MVVAEIPLWLIHASSSVGGPNGVLGETRMDAKSSKEKLSLSSKRAQDSLSLLENSGRGKKCAIYSVDVSPCGTKFATSGGDGMVRLWSMPALFSRKRSRYVKGDSKGGSYESSEASDFSDNPSSGEDNDNLTSNSNSNANNSNISTEKKHRNQEERVHDLNDFVRRKKGGEFRSQTTAKLHGGGGSASDNPVSVIPSKSTSDSSSSSNRLLATLAAHTGSSVLAVRFSTNGHYLASAGDDTVVCIYAPTSSAHGNLMDHNASEHWSRIRLCRGHGLDVVGLAWAPDDSHLVSCSLDSETPIIVWKLTDLSSPDSNRQRGSAKVLCNPYKILGKDIHTSTVKGVTFDPAGTYLASSGDDPAVCIWRAHDDWGLVKRIDSSTGIFRRWKEDDAQSLSSQTLFRRLSWSTDGAFICSTNCLVKNQHVASTISREDWSVSTDNRAAAGAANLVGHKQPIMVSRHSSHLIYAGKRSPDTDGSDSSDIEPEYATLLALGDRYGFVTIWSTRKSRPIFKLQCSESRCTITDLAWGKFKNNMVLLVSLLDGHIVALRFSVPDEVGPLLSQKELDQVFQLRYGIDMDHTNGLGKRRLFVGDNSKPKLIESALQLSLENQVVEKNKAGDEEISAVPMLTNGTPLKQPTSASQVKEQQEETRSKGKKRIRPVLMGVDNIQYQPKKPTAWPQNTSSDKTEEKNKKIDPLQYALDLANKASSSMEAIVPGGRNESDRQDVTGGIPVKDDGILITAPQTLRESMSHLPTGATTPLPHSTRRIQSVELPISTKEWKSQKETGASSVLVGCSNSLKIPTGSSQRNTTHCVDISISQGGKISWKDQIPGTSCSALVASKLFFAVGTSDGCVQLYGASPTLGWVCRNAFRSHPSIVFGSPVVALQLHEKHGKEKSSLEIDMLVLIADGTFGIYNVFPNFRLCYKGSVMPAMTHMHFGRGSNINLPKVSRIQLTHTDHLFLLLSSDDSSNRNASDGKTSRTIPRHSTGSLQAFVYNAAVELWMRISDGRFALSDFYSTLPTSRHGSSSTEGVLSWFDDAVRIGTIESSLASKLAEADSDNFIATRSHCEDRMACSLALESAPDFKHWLSLYAKILSRGGHVAQLRVLVDLFLGPTEKLANDSSDRYSQEIEQYWWLSSAPTILKLDRKSMIRTILIPEMSKNRALQRMTNELSLEVESNEMDT